MDEGGQILLQLFQRGQVNVHHVPGFVVLHRNVVAQAGVRPQVVEGVLGGRASLHFRMKSLKNNSTLLSKGATTTA